MRERLAKIIYESFEKQCDGEGNGVLNEFFVADYIIKHGAVLPPCKIGTHLWKVTYPYKKEPKVTEFVVKNFKTIGKKHKIQIEVQALNTPFRAWMYYHQFCTTKEEAEKALKGGEGYAEIY